MKTLLSLSLLILSQCLVFAQNVSLWNGETPDIVNCVFTNGVADNNFPKSGQWAYKGSINQWKPGIINLKCQNTWRIDLSAHTEIHFYIRSENANLPIKIGLTGWPYASPMIDISPFVENGPVNAQYKLVKVPTSLLKTAEYPLHAVENIRFETGGTDLVEIYVDDLIAIDTEPNEVVSHMLLSNQVIRLDISDRYDMNDVLDLQHYLIQSPDDPDFQVPQTPSKVGRHFYVKGFPDNSTNPILSNELFLLFNKKFKNDKTYFLTVSDVLDLAGNHFASGHKINFTFTDLQLINHSVKVNQVGYFNWGPKYGYVGNFIGDAGTMPLFPSNFYLKNSATDQIVYSGIPDFRGLDTKLSGELIFECDFSSFNTPGKYYLYIPGLGRSFDFEVSDKAFDQAYYTAARGLYYQRCGVALNTPYADPKWTHGACHLEDGFPHSSWLNSALYNGEAIDKQVKMSLGWHDAGDYGKYATPGISALYFLLQMYQLYPEKFGDGELNIPESGNGIPDMLDEARHELLWLLNMQAPDGGVYERVTTLNWPTTMPEQDLATRYISEKTTHTTGQFSAIMAMAYRLYEPYLPEFAKTCLNKSKLAFNYLLTHPDVIPANGYLTQNTGMGGGAYPDPEGDVDERAWAAAELYKSTGELSYRNKFDVYWAVHEPFFGWNPFQHHQIPASMAYATTADYPVDENKVNSIKQAIVKYADNQLIPRLENNFYRSACRTDVTFFIGFGAFGQSSRYSWDLIMAYYFTGLEKYRKYALLSMDVQLGNNPQNMSYITGIGSKYPMDPLHHPTLQDNVQEPVPGIPVYGPSAHISMANPYNYMVQSTANLYPAGEKEDDPYPIFRRYYDISSNSAMSEFNVIDMTQTTSVLAFFKMAPLPFTNTGNVLTSLQYFKAVPGSNKVTISWETASEQEISKFVIERSQDGLSFGELTTLPSLGNSDSPQQYATTDLTPLVGVSYYRLKIINNQGKTLFSEIVKVEFATIKKSNIKLYPNPVNDVLHLEIPENGSQSIWTCRLVNFESKIQFSGQAYTAELEALINKWLPQLRTGVYVLQLIRDGEEYQSKFVKE
jgi:hypothetical protein